MIHIYLREASGDQSQSAHRLLHEILEQEYGILNPVLELGPHGKPFLPDGPHFNISHSRGHVAVAFSPEPVGLDMEQVRPFHEKLPQRIFSPGELLWFQRRNSCRVDFFKLWTLKESYYKYMGTGLPGFPNETDFYFDGQWHMRGTELWFSVMEEKTLLLTLCGEKQREVMIHRV